MLGLLGVIQDACDVVVIRRDKAVDLPINEDGDGPSDARECCHRGGDTIEFNTETLHLDLVVGST